MDLAIENQVQFHNSLILPNIGEFMGSIIFAFLACFSGQQQNNNDISYLIFTSISLFISRSLVNHCSPAYLNPAVTIVQCIRKTISPILAISLILVQFIGFLFGVILFRSLVTQTEFNDDIVMYELVEIDGVRKIDRLQAFILEIALSIIFYLSFNVTKNRDFLISATWGFIQFISFPLFGFTSNISLLLVTSTVSYIFSPTTTPSIRLIYLNIFSTIISIFFTFLLDFATRQQISKTTKQDENNSTS